MAEPMHIRYAKAFSNLSLGRALYHPCPKSTLHLGVCGYFDHQGDWKTIVDIVKMDLTAAPADLKLTSLNPVPSVTPPSVSQWDPICSKNVAYEKLENSAQVGYDILLMIELLVLSVKVSSLRNQKILAPSWLRKVM